MEDTTFECGDGVVDIPGFVERVGVNADLDVHFVGHRERRTKHRRTRAPVFVALEANRASLDLLDQRRLTVPVSLPENADIDGPSLEGTQHHADVPGPRCD